MKRTGHGHASVVIKGLNASLELEHTFTNLTRADARLVVIAAANAARRTRDALKAKRRKARP